MRFCFAAVVIDVNAFEPETIISIVCSYVGGRAYTCSCTLSGLCVVCGCIHGCTLSILRDALVANAECTYICALSVQYQTLSRAASLPLHEDCMI